MVHSWGGPLCEPDSLWFPLQFDALWWVIILSSLNINRVVWASCGWQELARLEQRFLHVWIRHISSAKPKSKILNRQEPILFFTDYFFHIFSIRISKNFSLSNCRMRAEWRIGANGLVRSTVLLLQNLNYLKISEKIPIL